MANKHRKVWKMVSRKMNFRKQTWPKRVMLDIKILLGTVSQREMG
jgi:hypothetical protein